MREVVAVATIGGFLTVVFVVNTYFSDDNLVVGYTPIQPIPFSHEFHVGQLKLDCRYCHTNVERSQHSTIPAMDVCMGCHQKIKTEIVNPEKKDEKIVNPKLAPLLNKYKSEITVPVKIKSDNNPDLQAGSKTIANPDHLGGGQVKPVEWVRVHKLPDYVYFNHAVHVKQGVSCVECHGRVDQMAEVGQQKSFSMKFCLDCHRDESKLYGTRPADKVFDLGWSFPDEAAKKQHIEQHSSKLNPPKDKDCSSCHR
jgi:hypothetical protein